MLSHVLNKLTDFVDVCFQSKGSVNSRIAVVKILLGLPECANVSIAMYQAFHDFGVR